MVTPDRLSNRDRNLPRDFEKVKCPLFLSLGTPSSTLTTRTQYCNRYPAEACLAKLGRTLTITPARWVCLKDSILSAQRGIFPFDSASAKAFRISCDILVSQGLKDFAVEADDSPRPPLCQKPIQPYFRILKTGRLHGWTKQGL